MSSETIVTNLLNGVQFDDPRIYDMLRLLIADTYSAVNTLFPPEAQSSFGVTGQVATPSSITNFIATITGDNVRFTWDNVGVSVTYEIRYKAGVQPASSWDTASVLVKTSTTVADINPKTVPLTTGSHTFFIKSVDSFGNYSTNAVTLAFNVAVIPAPVITPSVISNNVLLYWTTPTSTFDIDHYNIYKDGVIQGLMNGTFEAIFELTAGMYSYTVEAVDIVGNKSTISTAAVVQVSSPTDFTFRSSITSTFTGTKTNCQTEMIAGVKKLLVCIDTTKTYQHHFDDNAWASPQAQVTAGYPIFIQPAKTTGSYQEVFDFGSIITNVIVVLNWNLAAVANSVAVSTSTIEVSNDNITYGAPTTGFAAFAASVRYVRFTMNFVGADDKSLAYISNLQCLINVRTITDEGTGSAVSTDAGGTTFNLNKAFLAAPLVTVTPVSTTAAFAIVTSITTTTFKVLVFDDTGTRITKTINWVARGTAQ